MYQDRKIVWNRKGKERKAKAIIERYNNENDPETRKQLFRKYQEIRNKCQVKI